MRLRDQNKADLALTALTLTVATASAGYRAYRWARTRIRHYRRRGEQSRRDAHLGLPR